MNGLRNIHIWVLSYLKRLLLVRKWEKENRDRPIHILFTICDHFEPYWNNVNDWVALNRVDTWITEYPKIASNHKDSLGRHPRYCFFYPIEEYHPDLMNRLAFICKRGFGEVEIHLHHDNDTGENLRHTILNYKAILFNVHGLLCKSKFSSEIKYGFVHGNWALDNSRPDGKWCGVNNEISILEETGCYADFTMPSAPDITQTRTVNSIYYAIDDPIAPKSHDKGMMALAGAKNTNGLLCIQGPLAFDVTRRKWGILPRIENGCITPDVAVTPSRIRLWIKQLVHVHKRPDILFVKLHTHGAQEKIMDFFFEKDGLNNLFFQLKRFCLENRLQLHYVSAREMYNVVKGLENHPQADVTELLDYELIVNW